MAGGHPAAPLALDTNPFLLLVTYRYLKSKNATALERMLALSDVRDQSDYVEPELFDDLWYIFENTKRRIITQHVIAEALKFSRPGWLQGHKDAVRDAAISLLDDFRVEEHSCPILDLHANGDYRKVLIALGYTDAGLLHTAERHKATLITEDTKLLSFAYARFVPAFPLSQLRALIAQSR
jgi:predicted nucleic acid-binding protein